MKISLTTLLLISFTTFIQAQDKPKDYKQLQDLRIVRKAQLDKKYIDALKRLKTKYTKAGNLEIAVMINKEIEDLVQNKASKRTNDTVITEQQNTNNEKFVGSWILREGSYTTEFKFNKDGSVDKIGENHRADWLTYKDYLIIVYPDGGAKVFSFKNKLATTSLIRIGKKGELTKQR
ncbi:hypothetical protein OAG44_01110 [bacterium]|nr:hypothetical protein [bacterium]MDC0321510.1 hypothetical protein [Akkermansiaceae bacterium]